MALAGRSPRRSAGRRWLVLAVLITVIVVVVDASLRARSPAPIRLLAGQAWLDRALPVIEESTEQGQRITQIRAQALTLGAASISAQLKQTAGAAAQTYQRSRRLNPPATLDAASSLLQTCLLVRSEASTALARALTAELASPSASVAPTDPGVQAVATAGQDLEVADRAYQLFEQNLPPLGARPPTSQWVPDGSQYDPATLTVFLETLRNATNLTPVHQVAVVALTTNPAAVSTDGTTEKIPPAKDLSVSIVLANTGNQTEKDLTVTVAITPAATGASQSLRYFISLAPGGFQTVELGPLLPPTQVPVTLTATIGPATGQAQPQASSKSIVFLMP